MEEIVSQQREFFYSGKTKNINFRIQMLKRLKVSIEIHQKEIEEALYLDLGKSPVDIYITEIMLVLEEIDYAIKNLKKWAREEKVSSPIALFPGKSYITYEPYGVVLILSPWNYPFQLALAPLVGAIAGGNTAIIKTSRSSVYTSFAIEKILKAAFKEDYICYIDNAWSHEEILNEKYDLIFFTGSQRAGKTVMKSASKHLTPVVLELGGKNPCIVDKSTNISVTAKRIVWGRFLNSGQTCIAPDYILVDYEVKPLLLKAIIIELEKMYKDPLNNPQYGKIISQERFDHLVELIEGADIVIGGDYDVDKLKIAPAIIPNATFKDKVMEEEIFGPILPIIAYNNIEEVINNLQRKPKPLALYVFTKNKKFANNIINNISSGGAIVNDVILHVGNHKLPFGGVGESGMGSYHGEHSFKTFSHKRSIVKQSNCMDMPLRYPPYKKYTEGIIKLITKI